jgi:hypothetical protein
MGGSTHIRPQHAARRSARGLSPRRIALAATVLTLASALFFTLFSAAYGALDTDTLSLGVSDVQSSTKIDTTVDSASKIDTSSYQQTVSDESASLDQLAESSQHEDVGSLSPTSAASASAAFDSSGYWASGRTTVYDDGTRDPDALICAVSREYSYLKGSTVEIYYNGRSVYVTIDDVGNFEQYGYVMDFLPAVCEALGFEPGDNPCVSYRLVS